MIAESARHSSGYLASATLGAGKRSHALRVETFIAFSLASIVALSGTARGLIIPGFRISEVGTLAILLLVVASLGPRFVLAAPPIVSILGYCVAFSTIGMAHFVQRTELGIGSLGEEVVVIWQYAFLAIIAINLVRSAGLVGSLRPFLASLAVFSTVNAILALLQVLKVRSAMAIGASLAGNPEILDPPNWKVPRGTGLFNSWHASAMFCAISFTLFLMAYNAEIFKGSGRTVLLACTLMSAIGAIASLTATPVILILLSFVLLSLSGKRLFFGASTIAVGVVAIAYSPLGVLVSDRFQRQSSGDEGIVPQTVWFRFEVWINDYLPVIAKSLWLGYGTLGDDSGLFKHTESMYIWLLLHGGILLLVFFVAMYVRVGIALWTARRGASEDPATAWFLHAVTIVAGFLPIAMILHPYLKDAGGSQLFFVIVGLAAGAVSVVKSSNGQPL